MASMDVIDALTALIPPCFVSYEAIVRNKTLKLMLVLNIHVYVCVFVCVRVCYCNVRSSSLAIIACLALCLQPSAETKEIPAQADVLLLSHFGGVHWLTRNTWSAELTFWETWHLSSFFVSQFGFSPAYFVTRNHHKVREREALNEKQR